jgi:hypothetical protein
MVGNEDLSSADVPKDKKWTRARKPKVKTGCITCKIRRVKCDETKPECRRCIKFGMYHFMTDKEMYG